MLELTAAFGALADHRRHLTRFDVLHLGTRRFGMAFQPPVDEQQAFRHGLFGRCQQAFVEPNRVRRSNFVQASGNVLDLEPTPEHLRRQQPDAGTYRPGDEDLENPLAVVIDGNV